MRHTRIALIAALLTLVTAAVGTGVASAAPRVGRITQINLPPPRGPAGITVGPDGNLWFTILPSCCDTPKYEIGMLTPSGQFTGFTVPSPHPEPTAILSGPDGNLWFDEFDAGKIGTITTAGVVTEYPLPQIMVSGAPANVNSQSMIFGPDGALWFTGIAYASSCCGSVGVIGRMDLGGNVTYLTLPSPRANPEGIVTGSDGALWFADPGTQSIGRMTSAGAFTSFPVPQQNGFTEVFALASGPDGNIWFTDAELNTINRLTPAGKVTVFPLKSANPIPEEITAGPDGAMWFTEGNTFAPGLGRITMKGAITEYTAPSNGGSEGITPGPPSMPHTVWFTQQQANNVDFITTK